VVPLRLMADDSDSDSIKRGKTDRKGQTAVLDRPKLKRPPLYKVILLNDDYTTQEFVILILRKFFQKNNDDALRLMRAVHNTGKGIAGVYPHDIAVTKVRQVQNYAQQFEMPLRLTIEAE
jgi:ATP-dependent Clp protease adaptor protein ClpS